MYILSKQKAKKIKEAICRKKSRVAIFRDDNIAGFKLRKVNENFIMFADHATTESEIWRAWNEKACRNGLLTKQQFSVFLDCVNRITDEDKVASDDQ